MEFCLPKHTPTLVHVLVLKLEFIILAHDVAHNLLNQMEQCTESPPMMLVILQATNPPRILIAFPTPISSVLYWICYCNMHQICGMCYAPRCMEFFMHQDWWNVLRENFGTCYALRSWDFVMYMI
jgi:hypothetical protein